MNHLIDGLKAHQDRQQTYLVLGTLQMGTWRQGLSGNATIDEVRHAMADFKAYMRVDITPQHRSPRSATTD